MIIFLFSREFLTSERSYLIPPGQPTYSQISKEDFTDKTLLDRRTGCAPIKREKQK